MNKFIIVLALFILAPYVASAHATPVEMSPASGERLVVSPEDISIRFSERLEPGSSNIRLEDTTGAKLETAQANVDRSDEHRLLLPMSELPEGAYIVSWGVVSKDDGHFTKGSYAFSVGSSTPVTVASDLAVVTIAAYPEVAMMFVEFLGNSLLWGTLALFLFAIRPAVNELRDASRIRRWVTAIFVFGGILVLVGALGQFLVKAYELAGLHEAAFRDSLLMYANTAAGSATLLRMAVMAGLLTAFAIVRRRVLHAMRFGADDAIVLGLLVAFAYARATVSHATANPFFPELSVVVNTLHLIEKDLWLGVLLVLTLFVVLNMRELLLRILSRANEILAANFVFVAITASYIIWLHVKSFANLRGTEWGSVFVWLGACAAMLIAFRTYHVLAYRFRPRLFSRAFPATIAAEAGLALLVVWFSSQIIITSPPLPSSSTVLTETTDAGAITLLRSPYEDDTALVTLPEGASEPIVIVGESDGGLIVELTKRFEGGYVFPLSLIARDTQVHISAPMEHGYDARATFSVTEGTFAAPEGHGRTFDLFTSAMLLIALLGAVSAGMLLVVGRTNVLGISIPHGASYVPLLSLAAAVAIGFVVAGAVANTFQNEFKRQCLADGNGWHLMQPTKAGVIVSETAREGCMLAGSTYHIADAREYAYLRSLGPAEAKFEVGTVTEGVPARVSVALTETTGEPAVLSMAHEKFLHMVIVGKDMDYFAHVHPEDDGIADIDAATFSIEHTFPKSGTYIVAVDYLHGLVSESEQFLVEVGGGKKQADDQRTYTSPQTVGPYEVALSYSQPIVGEWATLIFEFEKDGKPVYDLEPYLAAAMHVAVVKQDLTEFIHTHGEVHKPGDPVQLPTTTGHNHAPPPLAFGPQVEAHLIFPSPGLYTVFGEFKHEGEVRDVRFTVRVE